MTISILVEAAKRPKKSAGGSGGGLCAHQSVQGRSPDKFVKFDTTKHFRWSILSILEVIGMFERMPNVSLRKFKFYWSRETK